MNQLEEQQVMDASPYVMFSYSIRSPYTKETYFRRLRRFFDALSVDGTFEDKCNHFAEKGKKDPAWAFNSILRYILAEKERVEKKEITGGTLRNCVKVIKTFCEVTDVMIPWKKITRGLPRVKRYADDRAPTIEEITKIIEYQHDESHRSRNSSTTLIEPPRMSSEKAINKIEDYLRWAPQMYTQPYQRGFTKDFYF